MTACPYVDASECHMARERSVAGVSDRIPVCPEHGGTCEVCEDGPATTERGGAACCEACAEGWDLMDHSPAPLAAQEGE